MGSSLNTLTFFVSRTQQLHTLPAVALEVIELTDHPRVDCRKLKECIERDPALVSKLLRVVNSSLFGLGSQVSDLNQAIALIGIKSLKLLVLGFSLSDTMFRGATSAAMEHAWRHTLTRAVAARELCESVWRVSGDEAFIAGLVAELGKFVLLEELGEPYSNLLSAAAKDHEDPARFEQASLGFNHTELTAELLNHWGLPATLVSAVRLSAKPEQLRTLDRPENLLPSAVRMAGLIADLLVDDRAECLRELMVETSSQVATISVVDELRISSSELQGLVARVQERVGLLADVMSFALPKGQDYRDVLVAAHHRLAQLSADAACLIARQLPIAEKRGAEVASVSTAVARYVNRHADQEEPPARRQQLPRRLASSTTATATHELTATATVAHPPETFGREDLDARMLERLTTAVTLCRQARCPLSLILVELDRLQNFSLMYGPVEAQGRVRQLQTACATIDHPGAVCMRLGESRFALIVADCDRRAAVLLGEQLLRGVRAMDATRSTGGNGPTLSVGVATVGLPSKNFPPADLCASATRCLDAAHLSGGNTLKSIDVY